ncbi:MAG: hypothetical protein V7K55_12570 [Nostoc sp.]|uniref:hypothetical protein n=1 Tax=Nostoc sp. TaxID=1180 RepID=UPI002FFAC188
MSTSLDGLQVLLAHLVHVCVLDFGKRSPSLHRYLRYCLAIARSQIRTAAISNPRVGDRRPQKIKSDKNMLKMFNFNELFVP